MLTSGAVTLAPSKQGSTSSPKIHNLENIASFIMKKSIPVLLFVDQCPSKVFSSNSIDWFFPFSKTDLHSSYCSVHKNPVAIKYSLVVVFPKSSVSSNFWNHTSELGSTNP